jgi:MOSC domain-containing protein YiiM
VAHVLSVNLAVPRPNPIREHITHTGIDKRPATGPVEVRAPAARGTGGLTGDQIHDFLHHGGPDQAVYAYAREDLDAWQAELGRELPGGAFGENLTTAGLDVTGALIGERWRVGGQLVLEVAGPRIPCATFAHWMAEQRWVKRFTAAGQPGAYLRVVAPGTVRAGDPVALVHRPDHDVTVGLTFRALTLQPELLPRLLAADALSEKLKERVTRRGEA